ncbi:hypothetical protein [uncultured Shimia sp.]|uniref:hypothetical protein n=1 Tax=uncultured Shimia sp. TaxID=573152 RepID=UPI00261B40D8|nr:hypothetical protein [uncultured Shimia sp.]
MDDFEPELLATLFDLCQLAGKMADDPNFRHLKGEALGNQMYATIAAQMYVGASTPPSKIDVSSVLATIDIALEEGRDVGEDVALWVGRQSAQRTIPRGTTLS